MGHGLYQLSEMHFRLLGTNRFHVKAKKGEVALRAFPAKFGFYLIFAGANQQSIFCLK